MPSDEKAMKSKGHFLGWLFVIIVTQFFVFMLWVYQGQPDPSVSIGEIIIIAFLAGLNLLLGVIIYFYPQRRLSRYFFANAIVAPVIFHLVWVMWYSGWNERNYDEYYFPVGNAKFELSLSKTDNYFSISDITNQINGSTSGLFLGTYEVNGDTTFLVDGETKMKIVEHKLFGFPQLQTGIRLEEVNDK